MASGYPLLPGFAPTQEFKENYRKVSSQKQEFNRDVNNVQQTKYVLPREKQFSEPNKPSKVLISTTHDHFPSKNSSDTSKLYQPDWVRLDRHVLRFYAYFRESVVERNGENLRNRKVKILFYLEDNSISINEEKHENSGIPQGIFLKREKALNSNGNGKFFTPQDFKVGECVVVYGREYFVYNCDEYTREFYEKISEPQGPALQYNNDQWTSKVTTKWVPQKDAEMKNYLQKKLGGGRVTSQKQFLQLDRKVLKFYSLCEGTKYIVHFFLADDTIEIREMSVPNSGKDPFPVTVKRHKLPKEFCLNQPGQTYAQNFVTADELQVGQTITVYGRKYYLEGSDDFTRYFYAMKLGKEFPEYNKNNTGTGYDPRANIIVPPHNGIGSEEDSRGYIYKLVPKPPKKDFFQWVDQQFCLRFTGIPSSPKPEDANRKFIITYFLNDNSLMIYEPPIRNSGMYEGKFLQRNQYKKQDGQIYKPEDLVVGYDVKINGHCFHITDCDDFTKKWYSENTLWEQNNQ